jgi:hypothetical protein
MKHYSKFFEIYTVFHALVRTQYYAVIKFFKCDLDEKYTSNKFCELFALDETIHRTLYSYTPEQNSVAKREHRHIIEYLIALCSINETLTSSFLIFFCISLYFFGLCNMILEPGFMGQRLILNTTFTDPT